MSIRAQKSSVKRSQAQDQQKDINIEEDKSEDSERRKTVRLNLFKEPRSLNKIIQMKTYYYKICFLLIILLALAVEGEAKINKNTNIIYSQTECSNVSDWVDANGFDCLFYEVYSVSFPFITKFENKGHSASSACCYYNDDGIPRPDDEMSTILSPTLADAASNNVNGMFLSYGTCYDYTNWADEYGITCFIYDLYDISCDKTFADENGDTVSDACCHCGGGFYLTALPSSKPSMSPSLKPSPSTFTVILIFSTSSLRSDDISVTLIFSTSSLGSDDISTVVHITVNTILDEAVFVKSGVSFDNIVINFIYSSCEDFTCNISFQVCEETCDDAAEPDFLAFVANTLDESIESGEFSQILVDTADGLGIDTFDSLIEILPIDFDFEYEAWPTTSPTPRTEKPIQEHNKPTFQQMLQNNIPYYIIAAIIGAATIFIIVSFGVYWFFYLRISAGLGVDGIIHIF